MPPRYVYWTIVAGGLPTAFRAAERDELLPTFKRLQHTHPDAEMKYFARGKLWGSAEDAEQDAAARRAGGHRQSEGRGRNWRPGGEHTDPRQKFKDAKKDRNLGRRKQRFERRQGSGKGEPPSERFAARPDRDKPAGPPRDKDHRPFGRPPHEGPRDRQPLAGPPRDRKPFAGPPRDGPPRTRPPVGGSRDRSPRDRKPLEGPPRDRTPRDRQPFAGPPRDRKPFAGPPRDRRRRS
jgi:hypothetical protein